MESDVLWLARYGLPADPLDLVAERDGAARIGPRIPRMLEVIREIRDEPSPAKGLT